MVIFLTLFFLGNIGHENVFYDILDRKNAFLGYKTKKFKKSKKIGIFPKGLTHGFGTKTGIFRTFILSKIGQKMFFYDILVRRNASLGFKKTRSSKSGKIHIFSKGLTPGSGPKMAIVPTFVFRQYRPGKCLLPYSRIKNTL